MPEGTIERPLSPSLPRDCGHECRVCKVTVASLTDYASHISSPIHKQNVEAFEKRPTRNKRDEEYFDQTLVELIEKRKEQIRKDKEAAAAKLAKEEEERRRKEAFEQRLKEAQGRYQCARQQQSQGFNQHNSWFRNNQYNARTGEAQHWQHNRQGKSATWHAQEPPNFKRWDSQEFNGGRVQSQDGWGNRQWDHGACLGNQQSRLPWLSNGGSSNGVYGRNNISQNPQRGRPWSLGGPPYMDPPSSNVFSQALSQFQNTSSDQACQQRGGVHSRGGQTSEADTNASKSSKTFGSNPKLDKACRWSPYPVTKGSESVPHKDTNPASSEKHTKIPKPQKQDKTHETRASNREPRPEKKQELQNSSAPQVQEKTSKTDKKTKARDESSSCSSSRSSSAQRDGNQISASGPSNQTTNKPLSHKDQKRSSGLSGEVQISKSPSQAQPQSKSTIKQSELSPQASLVEPLQSRQGRKLPETLNKARQIVSEKARSLNSPRNSRARTELHIFEEQQKDHAQSQSGVNKENSCRQNEAKPSSLDSVRPEKPVLQSSDSSHFLQSLQVSTSTMESSEPAAPSIEHEEKRKRVEKETCPATPEETQPAVEAAQSSESDTSRSGEVQAAPGSDTPSLSKVDVVPVIKRDLTKHISSKSKTGSHEPNLNIARRVRNLSESRRSDTEKDSGLKPTVRQLISSSGSRRNVNWDQVYQEVRKKQDKGKGMPRFGIEMVPCDQEDHSQGEDGIPELEGFQWDSLMEASTPPSSRKRSLSESSIAPASTNSLITTIGSKEVPVSGELSLELQGSSTLSKKCSQRRQEVEQMLVQFKVEAQTQPDRLTSATVKALQRSDSVLGDSSSGTEQCDGQGTGKRRRAAGDVPNAETSCLEHNNKRRKVKSKQERLQIDQLLAVSLREEELSRTLQTVDSSLIQARAALEAAYVEVQRLIVVKQQMTGEMSTLRNKRIDLLKGMQVSQHEAPQVKVKEERVDAVEAEPHMPASIILSSVMETAASPCPSPPAERASPPPSHLPFMPAVIKQEPQSPIHVSSETDPMESFTHCAHSTTPEQPIAPASLSEPGVYLVSSPERRPELYQTKTEHTWETLNEAADYKESSLALAETTDIGIQATRSSFSSPPDSKSSIKLLSPSRRGSEVGSAVDCEAPSFFEIPLAPLPLSPPELRSGKRVRKLKKRKVLKKAQGVEQPESSDTELDGEALRPRLPRPRRRASGCSQVSTSTLPSEDREADVNMEVGEDSCIKVLPAIKQAKVVLIDLRSPKHTVDFPQMAKIVMSTDSEKMDDATFSQHLDPLVVDLTRPEALSLACNEVTSTSDMEICKSSESDVQMTKFIKISSDASSDHGEDDLPTEGVFEGHQETVNAMEIHNGLLYTCSGDRTVRAFDLVSHKCVGVFEGHGSKVSCLLVSAAPFMHHRLYTGSSDQTIRCYNLKTQELEQQFSLPDRVLCLHSRWKMLYAGLANGTVVTFNLKTNKQIDEFECHGPRAVSCLASSQEGARKILLVGSFDSTISVRDAKNGLLLRTLEGHTKTILCMKVVNDLVFSGSSDQCVYSHNVYTGELVRVYKGHNHAVTVVAVLGKVMVTACLDKLVRVYDLQSHEQLQVYGGHKDMVMCMAVHKNMIYTGCYDGSVQAVKLNLMQNYSCRWQGCSMVFGMTDHLHQHLINDHTSVNSQTLKCRWNNCEEFFCARNSSKQGMLVHMQKHAEEETKVEP